MHITSLSEIKIGQVKRDKVSGIKPMSCLFVCFDVFTALNQIFQTLSTSLYITILCRPPWPLYQADVLPRIKTSPSVPQDSALAMCVPVLTPSNAQDFVRTARSSLTASPKRR